MYMYYLPKNNLHYIKSTKYVKSRNKFSISNHNFHIFHFFYQEKGINFNLSNYFGDNQDNFYNKHLQINNNLNYTKYNYSNSIHNLYNFNHIKNKYSHFHTFLKDISKCIIYHLKNNPISTLGINQTLDLCIICIIYYILRIYLYFYLHICQKDNLLYTHYHLKSNHFYTISSLWHLDLYIVNNNNDKVSTYQLLYRCNITVDNLTHISFDVNICQYHKLCSSCFM